MKQFTDLSSIILLLGILAFLVSVVTEVLKRWAWLDRMIPSSLLVIIVSLVICPLTLLALCAYIQMAITWYMVFGAFVAAFVVALVAMDGWERVTDLANRLIKK